MSTLQYKGVNLSGLEFGNGVGVYDRDYTMPARSSYDYWGQQVHSNVVRLPFTWERLQPQLGGALDQNYLSYLKNSVSYAKANGITLILDLHNYARYNGQVVTSAQLTDVWTKLGNEFKGDSSVWLNLMNEPHDISATQWAGISQQTLNALRASGINNKILISGTSWSGAHSWNASGNAAAYANFKDPLNNYAYDVHQYLDSDSSGTSATAIPGSGSTRLVDITSWAESTGQKLFLGEAGVADNAQSQAEMSAMIKYMESHSGAWLGFTLWGGGPWWPDNYIFEINPNGSTNDQSIANLMALLQPAGGTQTPPPPPPPDPGTTDPGTGSGTGTGGSTGGTGTTGNTVDNTAGTTTINGTSGDDTVRTFASQMDATDSIKLGAGTDTLVFRDANFTFDSTKYSNLAGIDVIDAKASTGNALLQIKNAFMDSTDNHALLIMYGQAGIQLDTAGLIPGTHEVLINGGGVVRMWGGSDDITVTPGTTGSVYGGDGNDYVRVRGGEVQIYGQTGNDTMDMWAAAKVTLDGGDGDDTFAFNGDLLTADVRISGGLGTDALLFRTPVNVSASDAGNVTGIEVFRFSGAGNSFALTNGMTGSAFNVGGSSSMASVNFDVAALTMSRTITIDPNVNLSFTGSSAAALTLQMAATANGAVAGSSGNDVIYGNGSANDLRGGAGSDTITGGGGADRFTVKAGDGSDTITDFQAGSGGDVLTLDGYALTTFADLHFTQVGADLQIALNGMESLLLKNVTASSLAAGNFVFQNGTTPPPVTDPTPDPTPTPTPDPDPLPTPTKVGTEGNDILTGKTSFNDVILGGGGNDTISGRSGNDKLYGQEGNDTLYGATGNDILYGGAGGDRLYGETGRDILTGGAGIDTLTGGGGSDVFRYTDIGDAGDIIADFRTSQSDKIDISVLLESNGFGGHTASEAVAGGYVEFKQSGADTILRFDHDGAAGSDSAATLLTLQNVKLVSILINSLIT